MAYHLLKRLHNTTVLNDYYIKDPRTLSTGTSPPHWVLDDVSKGFLRYPSEGCPPRYEVTFRFVTTGGPWRLGVNEFLDPWLLQWNLPLLPSVSVATLHTMTGNLRCLQRVSRLRKILLIWPWSKYLRKEEVIGRSLETTVSNRDTIDRFLYKCPKTK